VITPNKATNSHAISSALNDSKWKSLEVVAVAAALLAAIVFRRWLSAEYGMFRSLGAFHFDFNAEPATPLDWFALLHTNRIIGLLMLNAFDLVNYLLVVLTYLGSYSVLRRYNRIYMALAMAVAIIGISIYVSSNQAFNLLSLSDQYWSTTSETQKTLLLAAAQVSLNMNNPVTFGTGLFWSYMCLYSAGFIISLIMLRSNFFGKWTAVLGIVANAFGLGYFFTAAFAPSLSIIPAVGSAPCNLVWYVLIAAGLIKHLHTSGKSSGVAK
jgi:hypothetical protein